MQTRITNIYETVYPGEKIDRKTKILNKLCELI